MTQRIILGTNVVIKPMPDVALLPMPTGLVERVEAELAAQADRDALTDLERILAPVRRPRRPRIVNGSVPMPKKTRRRQHPPTARHRTTCRRCHMVHELS